MLLIVEIALVIAPWRKGWRWRALCRDAARQRRAWFVRGEADP